MQSEYLNRKENILITAIDLLDESGIQGMTTKEIAKRQGVTEPAIYRQYYGKKEIILTILDQFSDFDSSIKNTIIENKMFDLNGVRYFFKAYAEYYQNYPQISTVMISYDICQYDYDTNQKIMDVVKQRQGILNEIIIKIKESGGMSPQTNVENVGDTLLGILWFTTYQWKVFNYAFSLKQKVMEMVDVFLRSFEVEMEKER